MFANQEERRAYDRSARKYYFALLMGSGGQTGLKRRLKEAVRRPGFVYSQASLDALILSAAVEGCAHDANERQAIADRSLKYILSEETMERACRMAAEHLVDEAEIHRLNDAFPHAAPNYRGIENDVVAFIRNERQVLYYYGYFHSKSAGASDAEFSSLTPVGELALQANANEFLILWEHQKIKMISQPPTAEINQVSRTVNPPECFGVSFAPYTDMLGYVLRQGAMSLDAYKYLVSRRKHGLEAERWDAGEAGLAARLDEIRAQIRAFGRERDRMDEDGRKELLKYLLGVRCDLPKDAGQHPFGFLQLDHACVTAANRERLSLVYDVYARLETYKVRKYHALFADCEADLRRRYVAQVSGEAAAIDGRVKIHWDLYNIRPDAFILLSVALAFSAVALGVEHVLEMTMEEMDAVVAYTFATFRQLLQKLGLRTQAAVKRYVQRAAAALAAQDYAAYTAVDEADHQQAMARYRTENAADLLVRIQQMSATATVMPAEDRQRNATLVNLLKSYYLHLYGQNDMLRCECCGEATFQTDAGEPYVEFHHLIPFGMAYGPDHYLNLFALCPNCHRKLHFLRTEDKQPRYEALSGNNYLQMPFVERLHQLRVQNLLRSYHLEFLLEDRAITIEEYNHVAV